MQSISAASVAGPSELILTLAAAVLFLSIVMPADTVARPIEKIVQILGRMPWDELRRLRKHYFHLFRCRGLTQDNATQALIFAAALWVLLRLWNHVGGLTSLWLSVVAIAIVAMSLWAWQHGGPRATVKRFVSVFYLPAIFLVLYPFAARQAERAFESTASYATTIMLPGKAVAGK